jgi:hypothetical protein
VILECLSSNDCYLPTTLQELTYLLMRKESYPSRNYLIYVGSLAISDMESMGPESVLLFSVKTNTDTDFQCFLESHSNPSSKRLNFVDFQWNLEATP